MTWGILGLLTWRFSFSLNNGLVSGYSVKRLLVQTCVRTAQFLFLLFLCQKESKLGRGVASSVALLERWVSFLVVLAGSCLVRLGVIYGLTSGPFETCHHQCLKAVCGGFRLPIWCRCGAFGWFPKAPLLHHSIFQSVSPLGFFLGLVGGLVKGTVIPLLITWMIVSVLSTESG